MFTIFGDIGTEYPRNTFNGFFTSIVLHTIQPICRLDLLCIWNA